MRLLVEPYSSQSERLPKRGRHILAQFGEQAIVVYQAFRPDIGRWAVEHGRFGGEFSFERMSWIKTSWVRWPHAGPVRRRVDPGHRGHHRLRA